MTPFSLQRKNNENKKGSLACSIPQSQVDSVPIHNHIGAEIIKHSWHIILKNQLTLAIQNVLPESYLSIIIITH